MSNARTIPWETIADWFAKNEQAIRDVMKFEGLRGAVNEVLRIAPEQPELAALREELASVRAIAGEAAGNSKRARGEFKESRNILQQRLAAAEQRNAELEKNAARYIWLRDKSESVHQFYLSTPIWFTGVKFNQESVDSTIDAAMAKPTESDLCAACDGAGSVSTGIAEASSTICNKCDGTGTKP